MSNILYLEELSIDELKDMIEMWWVAFNKTFNQWTQEEKNNYNKMDSVMTINLYEEILRLKQKYERR